MGCYSQWYAEGFSTPDDFRQALREQYRRFASLKHVIDYYVGIAQKQLPSVKYAGHGSQYDIVSGDDLTDADYDAICKHLDCDELHFSDLLDVDTIINRENPEACKYAYVLMECMVRLRSPRQSCYPARKVARQTVSQLNNDRWFVAVPH